MGLRPLARWDCGFESRRGHVRLSLVSVVCFQVEVSAWDRSLVQRIPTKCGVSNPVWLWSLNNEEAVAHWGGRAVAPWKNSVITDQVVYSMAVRFPVLCVRNRKWMNKQITHSSRLFVILPSGLKIWNVYSVSIAVDNKTLCWLLAHCEDLQ